MIQLSCRTWSVKVRNHCMDAKYDETLSLFLHISRCSIEFKPNHQLFAATLKSCAALSCIKLGKTLHSCIVKLGHLSCQLVSKGLINMYAKCGALSESCKLFDQTGNNDPVMWNIILSGFSGSKIYDLEAMKLFSAMHLCGYAKPNSVTIATILPVCARMEHADAGKSVHSYVIKSGLESDTLVGNSLISMYAKCGLVSNEAYTVFKGINPKDVVSWNAIISGLSENNLKEEAFKVFNLMLEESEEPNYATIANVLPVCASLVKNIASSSGRQIHGYVQRRGELVKDVTVCNALLSFYLRVGRVAEAGSLFRTMKSRDLVSWNAIIAGYALNGDWLKAMDLFQELLSFERIEVDSVTILSVLPACAHLQSVRLGKKIHGYILRHPNLHKDLAVGNALVSFYAKCNRVGAAFEIFSMITRRDLISWNSMLDAFTKSGYETRFLDLLDWMFLENVRLDFITILTIIDFCTNIESLDKLKETHCYSMKAGFLVGDSDHSITNKVLDAYAKCGNMEYAYALFKTSDTDLNTCNLMIRLYAVNDCLDHALYLFSELESQGMKPDAMTIMSLFPICTKMATIHLLRQCHGYVVKICFEDVHMTGSLLDVYAKCGYINHASKLFRSSSYKDLVMFTAMISGYAMHGMGEEALKVFNHMLDFGLRPDHVIITTVLSACSHTGLVSEGLDIFYSMEKVHGIKPNMEQYACVVDLLARGGRISEAYSFIITMPIEANANIWGTLLAACRTHYEVNLGHIAAKHLFEIKANDIGNYIVMSNLYATDARWEEVLEVRREMRSRDLKKPAGCSWIEVGGRENSFKAGDFSHPDRSIIYGILSNLDQQIKQPVQF